MAEPGTTEHRSSCVASLRRALQRVAMDASDQVVQFAPFVVVADELALDLEHWTEVGRSWGYVEGEILDRLSGIVALFDEMSGPEQAGRWTPDALVRDPGWQKARTMAREALRIAGWM